MLQKILIILTALAAFAANMAQAQLSTNPWVEANDNEAVAAIYQKQHRRQNLRALNYQAGETATIDRTAAYIQPEDLPQGEKEESLLDKVKNIFSSKKDEPETLIPATAANRQALAREKAAAQNHAAETSSPAIPSINISGQLSRLKKSLRLPKLPSINVNGMIQQFERASGIDFKKIGRRAR